MKVEAVTKYKFKGIEYESLNSIKETLHNTIGLEVIDKINRVCPPMKHKDLFNLLEVLCTPQVRKVLTECYNVTFEEIDEFDQTSQTINVLDIK